MSHPDPENTPETPKYFYPLINLFYYIAVQGALVIKSVNLHVRKTERLTAYTLLTPTEKYFFLLETFWMDVNWAELQGYRHSFFLVPKLQVYIEYFASISPGDIIFIEGPNDPLYTFRYNSSFLKYFSFFGLLTLGFNEKKHRIYEKRQVFAVDSITITDVGGVFLPILTKERNLHQWKTPDRREVARERGDLTLVTRRDEPFRNPFQSLFKKEIKSLPNHKQYKKGTFIFNVFLRGGRKRTILIDSENTLEDLHKTIQNAFDFYKDCAYAFFMDGKRWSLNSVHIPEGFEGPFADQVRIGEVGMIQGQYMLYVYDFHSEWHVKVELVLINEEPGPPQPIIKKRG
jgi:shikimate kinase